MGVGQHIGLHSHTRPVHTYLDFNSFGSSNVKHELNQLILLRPQTIASPVSFGAFLVLFGGLVGLKDLSPQVSKQCLPEKTLRVLMTWPFVKTNSSPNSSTILTHRESRPFFEASGVGICEDSLVALGSTSMNCISCAYCAMHRPPPDRTDAQARTIRPELNTWLTNAALWLPSEA